MDFLSGICHYCMLVFAIESWVHCNDARLSRTIAKEVLNCQPYILFYTRLKGKCDIEEEILTIEPTIDGPNTKKIKT